MYKKYIYIYIHTVKTPTYDIAPVARKRLRSSMPGTSDMETSTLPPGLLRRSGTLAAEAGRNGWIQKAFRFRSDKKT